MPSVVADSSPLVYLARLGQSQLLRKLYGTILIPKAVWEEVAVAGTGLPEAACTREAVAEGWVQIVRSPERWTGPTSALKDLGPGEVEAIQIARERGLRLIIDDMAGREVARQLSISFTGTLGVFIEAKQHRYIPAVKPFLNQLRSETNFRLSRDIYHLVLRLAGELNLGQT